MDMKHQSPTTHRRPTVDRRGRWWFLPVIFLARATHGQLGTNDVSVLAPPYGELAPTFWEQYGMAVLLGSVALLVVALLYWRVRSRPAAPAVLAPEVEARQALSACSSQPEEGKLLSEVSHILRRYLAEAFALPDDEVTTVEFCMWLAASGRAGTEVAASAARFLRECDQRKFAPRPDGGPLNAVAKALELIELAETRRAAQANELRQAQPAR
jgi:hypothetical protein